MVVKFLDRAVNLIALITLVILVALSIYALRDHSQVSQQGEASRYEIYKPDGFGDFAGLKAINPDVVGWIDVYGTNIDYPVVQGTDHRFYLNHDVRREYSLSGSIFLDYRNHGFHDYNTILYGHNMSPAAMFGAIKFFKQKDFFDSHRYGDLYFDDRHHGVEFFAMIGADGYDFNVYDPGITGEAAKATYLDRIRSQALHTRDIGITTEEPIVLLSTCSNVGTNERDILVGRVSDRVFDDPFAEEGQRSRVDAQGLWKFLKNVPPWLWILLLWLVVLAIYGIMSRRRKKKTGK